MKYDRLCKQCCARGYAWLGAVITIGLLPRLGWSDHPSGDPFAKNIGIDLQSSDNAGDAFGKFIANILWWVGLASVAMALIYAIMVTMHILNMSREEKDHHGTIGKWATVLVAVVVAIALGGLLFSGLGQVE